MRTGTVSLAEALRLLGFSVAHFNELKKEMELVYKSSNLKLVKKAKNHYKLTFLEGESGEIKLKEY